jgi:hypothetical protein
MYHRGGEKMVKKINHQKLKSSLQDILQKVKEEIIS